MGIFSLFDPSTDGTHGRSGPRSGGMRRKTACRPRLRLKGDASAAGLGQDRVRSCRSRRSRRPSARLPRGSRGAARDPVRRPSVSPAPGASPAPTPLRRGNGR